MSRVDIIIECAGPSFSLRGREMDRTEDDFAMETLARTLKQCLYTDDLLLLKELLNGTDE